MITKQFMTWKDLEGYCLSIVQQIYASGWSPELIVGIGRGGLIPATMLSHFLTCPMASLDISLRDSRRTPDIKDWIIKDAANDKRILVVDDINDTGATINWIIDNWSSTPNHIDWGRAVRFAMVIDNESSEAKSTPHYCGKTINKAAKDQWIVFPYEEFWKNNHSA